MIYVTGDTHGDVSRFCPERFPEQQGMTKEDYVIVCGDFGIWDDAPQERRSLDWLDARPFTTLFVAGNHSNYDRLMGLLVSRWKGGDVQYIRDSVIHLMRGQVFDIDGRRIFAMGGASSHDIDGGILEPDDPDFHRKRRELDRRMALYRINHVSRWREELPSDEEYATAHRNLDACGWEVDYIISHCCPTSIADVIGRGMYPPDRLTDFFEEVRERCLFDTWFFGHYHDDRLLLQKYMLLYEQIVPIDALDDERGASNAVFG